MELSNHAAIASASPVGAFGTMFYEPTRTFQQLENKPHAWFPLLALMASTVVLMLWYFSVVDFEWLLEQMFATIPSAEEREQAMQVMSKNVVMGSMLGSTLIGLPVVFAIYGLYLMVVSKMLSHGISFGKGFALAAWSSVPGILLLPLGVMQILLASSSQFEFSALNPVSLNQLVFHYNMAHPLAGILDALSLTTVWSTALMVLGLETWAKMRRSTALLVVLVPTVLVYGGWFAYAMSKVA